MQPTAARATMSAAAWAERSADSNRWTGAALGSGLTTPAYGERLKTAGEKP